MSGFPSLTPLPRSGAHATARAPGVQKRIRRPRNAGNTLGRCVGTPDRLHSLKNAPDPLKKRLWPGGRRPVGRFRPDRPDSGRRTGRPCARPGCRPFPLNPSFGPTAPQPLT